MMTVLLIEDSEAERMIVKEAFRKEGIEHSLVTVEDGVAALDYLFRRGAHAHTAVPNLILLDLNMPRMSGREVLARIKEDAKLRHIPVMVLSNSNSPADICECYALGVNCYIGKPSGFKEFLDLAAVIKNFWLSLVRYCPH